MNESNGYAVFFFPQALEALGDAIKPYLSDSPAGQHIVCKEIDTGGALIEMTLQGVTAEGKTVQLELMVPGSMVRMIVSSQSDGSFGFGPRVVHSPIAMPEAEAASAADAAPAATPAAPATPATPATP